MDLLDADRETVYLLNSLSIYEEGERKVATRQTRAIMQPDVWTMSTGVYHARAVGLVSSDYADCRGMSELLSAPPANQ